MNKSPEQRIVESVRAVHEEREWTTFMTITKAGDEVDYQQMSDDHSLVKSIVKKVAKERGYDGRLYNVNILKNRRPHEVWMTKNSIVVKLSDAWDTEDIDILVFELKAFGFNSNEIEVAVKESDDRIAEVAAELVSLVGGESPSGGWESMVQDAATAYGVDAEDLYDEVLRITEKK